MKINFKIVALNENEVELIDDKDFNLKLPRRYFDEQLVLGQEITINFANYSAAREILQEIFKTT
ncbi:MAG TPA: hypothetical protein PLJ58_01430 [bacterium]|jgi:hypothetical protein|nr:hypothetical protein [bacterium]